METHRTLAQYRLLLAQSLAHRDPLGTPYIFE